MKMRTEGLLFRSTALLLVASIALGGGTRPGFLGDVCLQLLSLPILVAVSRPWLSASLDASRRHARLICSLLVAVPLLQLMPLPPALWMQLPLRDQVVRVYDLIGDPISWSTLSVAPHFTAAAVLSLLPPIAVFLAVGASGVRERRVLASILLGAGAASGLLGLMQLAQGELSGLRFYAVTNRADAVGFFANRNHFAALAYCMMPLAAACLPVSWADRASHHNANPVVTAAALVIFVAAEAMARSRTGLVLSAFALIGSAIIAVPRTYRRRIQNGSWPWQIAAIGLALLVVAQSAFGRMAERFTSDPAIDGRVAYVRNTVLAAKRLFPVGSGIGTFTVVYPQFAAIDEEDPDVFVNRAHNDVLESIVESGICALVVLTLFLAWYAARLRGLWVRARDADHDVTDRRLSLAASMIVGLLLAHSFVDYPLRTGAMMAVMAMACGLLLPVPKNAHRKEDLKEYWQNSRPLPLQDRQSVT